MTSVKGGLAASEGCCCFAALFIGWRGQKRLPAKLEDEPEASAQLGRTPSTSKASWKELRLPVPVLKGRPAPPPLGEGVSRTPSESSPPSRAAQRLAAAAAAAVAKGVAEVVEARLEPEAEPAEGAPPAAVPVPAPVAPVRRTSAPVVPGRAVLCQGTSRARRLEGPLPAEAPPRHSSISTATVATPALEVVPAETAVGAVGGKAVGTWQFVSCGPVYTYEPVHSGGPERPRLPALPRTDSSQCQGRGGSPTSPSSVASAKADKAVPSVSLPGGWNDGSCSGSAATTTACSPSEPSDEVPPLDPHMEVGKTWRPWTIPFGRRRLVVKHEETLDTLPVRNEVLVEDECVIPGQVGLRCGGCCHRIVG